MKPILILYIGIAILFCGICWGDEIDDVIPFLIKVESGGDVRAISNKGAIGLFQIMPIVLKEWNMVCQENQGIGQKKYDKHKHPENLGMYWCSCLPSDFAPYPRYEYTYQSLFRENVSWEVGEWYLRRLATHYKCTTLEQILTAYNWGITRLRKAGYDCSKAPRSTRNYVKKVMKLYKEVK